MKMIDFAVLMNENKIVFSGKEKGKATRDFFDLDSLDSLPEVVEVVIPDSIQALTPSFVTGMFSRSVKKSGSLDGFFTKYRFRASANILKQIVDGAKSSLVVGTALSELK